MDWACKIDPLRCISLHGITDRYISGQKADAAGFVRLLLDDLESRISMQFGRVRLLCALCQDYVDHISKDSYTLTLSNCSLSKKLVTRSREVIKLFGKPMYYPTYQGRVALLDCALVSSRSCCGNC